MNKHLPRNIVDQLETEIERAITDTLAQREFQGLKVHPDPHTLHLMAKAAVTVYEAAIANRRP